MSGKITNAAARRYAGALLDLAAEANVLPKVEQDMADLRAMLNDSADLSRFVASPLFSAGPRAQALMKIAEKAGFQVLTKNFLGLLARNGRTMLLRDIIEAFFADVAERKGEVLAQVRSAHPMSDRQLKALGDGLSAKLGRKVTMNVEVEPSLIGGVAVTIGSWMIDNSVARKLERLRAAMSGTTNENELPQKQTDKAISKTKKEVG